LEEVIAALDAGADQNAIDSKGGSALLKACKREDWVVAETIVKELLRRGARTTLIDETGWTALHWAAKYSSCAVAELVANKTGINQLSLKGSTPLIICCSHRFDDEGVAIARMLVDRGANIEHKNIHGITALSYACKASSAAMVELLLARKANVNASDNTGRTPLMLACNNCMAGEAIIPMLIKAGADPLKKDNDGDTSLYYAFAHGGVAIMRAISPYVAANGQLQNTLPATTCPDPLGSMREAVRYGFNINRKDRLRRQVDAGESAEYCWAMSRVSPLCFDLSDNDIFNVMADSEDPTLWSLIVCDLSGQHHPMTGDTLLHVAVRSNKMYAVDSLMKLQVNPFWRNLDGLRPIDLAQDKEMFARLQSYSTFRPTRFHAAWFGPYFLQRAVAFLLVVLRWKTKDVRIMPKDVVLEIIKRVASLEYV
jgi:hypothetical protein